MTCISGPPCRPGNTAELIFLAMSSSSVSTMPPRGPRSVLWVVVVTTWAWPNGEGCSPAATRPAKCAMSTRNRAPTSSQIARNRAKSMMPRIGRAAGDDQPRLVLAGEPLDLVEIDLMVVGPDAVLDRVEPFARQRRPGAVGEMAAGVERQAHDRVAGLAAERASPRRWPARPNAAGRWRSRSRTIAWRARSPASRPRRTARSPDSSAGPDSLRHICW